MGKMEWIPNLDSDDDHENANGKEHEVDEAAIEKLLSEAKNVKTHLTQVIKLSELSSPMPASGASLKTPSRGILKARTPRSKANAAAEDETDQTPAKTPKKIKIVEEVVTPGKASKATPAKKAKTIKIEPVTPTEAAPEAVPAETLKTPVKDAKSPGKKNKKPKTPA